MASRLFERPSTPNHHSVRRTLGLIVVGLVALFGSVIPVAGGASAEAATVISITDSASCQAVGGEVVSGGCRFYVEVSIPAGTTWHSTMELQFCRDVVNDGRIDLASGAGLGAYCGTVTNNGLITMSNATLTVLNSQAAFVNNGSLYGCNVSVSGTISGNALASSCINITDTASCQAVGGDIVSGACRFYVPLVIQDFMTFRSSLELQFCRDVTNNGTLTLTSGTDLGAYCGTFTNNGTLTMSNATLTVLDSQAAFVNNGTVDECHVSVSGTISGNPPTNTCPDEAAPTTTITTPTPDGNNGWFVSDPTIAVSATDDDSGVATTRCVLDPASVPTTYAELPSAPCAYLGSGAVVGTDGVHTLYAASIDNAGNAGTPVSSSFKIDTVAPSLAPTVTPPVLTLNATGAVVDANATDAGSGVDASSVMCGTPDTTTIGTRSVTCSASDLAGNTNSAEAQYTVGYSIPAFGAPGHSRWKAGSAVPIKLTLTDAAGVPISDATATSLASSCGVTVSVTGAQTLAPACMTYDATAHQFGYPWKLAKSPTGAATVTVSVSNGPGNPPMTRSLPITITK